MTDRHAQAPAQAVWAAPLAPVGRVLFLTAAILLAVATAGAAQLVSRFGVMIPMRDRVRLAANIWTPGPNGRFPTILIRTPYDKTAQFRRYRLDAYLKAGYAVVLQDTRGRGDSEGEFDFYFPEGRDGYDTIEWIARQPWSNGRVGMDGGSYLGTVQWLAAREQPPHLACIAPTASSGRLFDEIPFLGGAFRLEWALPWLFGVSGRVNQSELAGLIPWDSLVGQRPLARLDTLLGRPLRLYQEILAHPTLDAYWRRIHFTEADFARIQVPTLTVTGWLDGDQPGALWYWDGLSRRRDAPPHYLIVGPWTHGGTYLGGDRKVGEMQFDSSSVLPIQRLRLEFFDWCLKQATPRWDAPRVRAFVPGTNRWLTADRYPIPGTTTRDLYLASGGSANTASGDGRLTWDPPGDLPPDRYVHDPRRPVPSADPSTDHRRIAERSDVLVYTSEALTAPVEILGRVFVTLWAASDAVDTDFTAKLLDVYPDGRSVLIGTQAAGVRRASYRKGPERLVPLEPNRTEEYSVELFDIGHTFLPGHRIRLEVASSAAPYINPNQGTGRPIGTDTSFVVARQTIWHDRARPSRIHLPIPPGGGR